MNVLVNKFKIKDIIGKVLIIHDMPDDFTTQPSGNSGTKIACGKIRKDFSFLKSFLLAYFFKDTCFIFIINIFKNFIKFIYKFKMNFDFFILIYLYVIY